MGRLIGRLLATALAVSSGLVLGGTGGGAHQAGPAALSLPPGQEAMLLSYPAGRAHPEGPGGDEHPTRTRPLYPTSTMPLWTGHGRHPVWRGCQHVYDPQPPLSFHSPESGTAA